MYCSGHGLILSSLLSSSLRLMDVRPFTPDAAIVNYYTPGDTLGGHLDDVEEDMDQPIVGLSLGCDAVFLMGGEMMSCFSWEVR